jgi:hypothetical protein
MSSSSSSSSSSSASLKKKSPNALSAMRQSTSYRPERTRPPMAAHKNSAASKTSGSNTLRKTPATQQTCGDAVGGLDLAAPHHTTTRKISSIDVWPSSTLA